MASFLSIQNADIGYEKTLIHEVNTRLDLGEVCLLVGNNGVGKTTLIKSIFGHTPLLNGEVTVGGDGIQHLSPKQIGERIAMVFSKAHIPTHYTVFDLVSLGKYIHYPYYYELNSKDREEVEAIIIQLRLETYQNTRLAHLSDGNLQKAFIGRALAQNSPMIILDEPTTHLDEENKIMILSLLRNLAKEENKCILFSSHDWRLAKEFSDQIWWISDSRLRHGMAEDVLLKNHAWTRPQLFSMNPNFVTPSIVAPLLEKEMLFSALQKNFNLDLSPISFIFEEGQWVYRFENQKKSFDSIEEIIIFLKSIYSL